MIYYVYHIACEGAGLDEGYVGVSVDPKERWARHRSPTSDSNPILKRAIVKYQPRFRVVALFDTLEEALWQEFTLRPSERIGWNLTQGGGVPPSNGGWNKGKKTPNNVRKKQSLARVGKFAGLQHPRARAANIYQYGTNTLVAKEVSITQWAKVNGYHQGHLSATARNRLEQHKGIYARYV